MRGVILSSLFVCLLLICLAPRDSRAAQSADSATRELKQRQKSERKALKVQQKQMLRAVKGPGHERAERKRLKRQMKVERKLLKAGQRDQMLSAREQQKMEKAARASSEP